MQQLDIYGDLHRFIPAFASKFGHKVKEIPVKHHPRKFGESHFGGFRLLEGFLDLFTVSFITHFLNKPSRLFGLAALSLFFIFILFLILACFADFKLSVASAAFIIVASVFFVSSILLFALSTLAEMFRHLSRRRDTDYMISCTLNH